MRKFCVIGTPVGHSKSPELFERFSAEKGFSYGKDVEYLRKEIKDRDELEKFIHELKSGIWSGCNVTMPWKTEMVKYMDEISGTAQATSAVNTVSAVNGFLFGDSTDGKGMLNAVKEEAGESLKQDSLLILGCGGAARSIIAEAVFRGYKRIVIACRIPEKLKEGYEGKSIPLDAVKEYDEGSNLGLTVGMLNSLMLSKTSQRDPEIFFTDSENGQELVKAVGEAEVLINCTPLGMLDGHGNENRMPVPTDIKFDRKLLVADCVYNPDETLLIKKAKESGCRVVKGIRMLEEQARCGADLLLNGKGEQKL